MIYIFGWGWAGLSHSKYHHDKDEQKQPLFVS